MTEEIKEVFQKYGYEDIEIEISAEIETVGYEDGWELKELTGQKTLTVKYSEND